MYSLIHPNFKRTLPEAQLITYYQMLDKSVNHWKPQFPHVIRGDDLERPESESAGTTLHRCVNTQHVCFTLCFNWKVGDKMHVSASWVQPAPEWVTGQRSQSEQSSGLGVLFLEPLCRRSAPELIGPSPERLCLRTGRNWSLKTRVRLRF